MAMEVSSHSLLLLQQLNVQREFGFLCDCTVAIGNVYFKAHRAVLAAFSNYFKMIFIHQSSECIKIQPSDIQPDVFSFLLHIMYTGLRPQQSVDRLRLQDGIRFLHAHQLARNHGDAEADAAAAAEAVRTSNLYGIQISSQLANKDAAAGPRTSTGSRGAHEDGRRAGPPEDGPSDCSTSAPRNVCSVASGDDSDISARVKQERAEVGEEPAGAPELTCPRCGERCSSPDCLREHLFSHALDPAHLGAVLPRSGELDGGSEEGTPGEGPHGEGPLGVRPPEEQLDAGCLEEALRQSRALANQLAAELRRSRGGSGTGSSPAPPANLHSRKRRIACAVCSLRFSHKSQLQEHMYAHTGRPRPLHRYHRLCSQLFHDSAHFLEGSGGEPGGGGGGASGASAISEDAGSSCHSLDSEASQESVDGVPLE